VLDLAADRLEVMEDQALVATSNLSMSHSVGHVEDGGGFTA
jgi:hypothetical protein